MTPDDLAARSRVNWPLASWSSQPGDTVQVAGYTGPELRIVVICGSTRFRAEITDANRRLTLAGAIVLAPGVFGHDGDLITEAQKRDLDALHRQKIRLADEVYVVDPGGYIGDSTRAEIEFAHSIGKPVMLASLAERQTNVAAAEVLPYLVGEPDPLLPPDRTTYVRQHPCAADSCDRHVIRTGMHCCTPCNFAWTSTPRWDIDGQHSDPDCHNRQNEPLSPFIASGIWPREEQLP